MPAACIAPVDAQLVEGLLFAVDCNVRVMTEAGYGALAQPNSPVALALTTLLTLYIGIMGFRLMIGRAPLGIGDVTMTVLKIAVVLTLATSWPAYQQLVFATLFLGPEQLAASVMAGVAQGGSAFGAEPFAGLQLAYDEMQRSAVFLSGRGLGNVSPFQGGTAFAAFALNTSSFMMLMGSLGAVLAAKIVLGLLLGLGPIFVAFLLFDSTRGLFEGWLRASIAFALAPLLAVLGLVVQLILIEPHVVRLAELRVEGLVDLGPPNAIFLLTLISTGVSIALAIAVAGIAIGLKLPSGVAQQTAAAAAATAAAAGRQAPMLIDARPAAQVEQQTRAATIAAAAAAMDRREGRAQLIETPGPQRTTITGQGRDGADAQASRPAPFGQTYRRTAQPRAAQSNLRRDA